MMLCVVCLIRLCVPAGAQWTTQEDETPVVSVTNVEGSPLPVGCEITIPARHAQESAVLQKTFSIDIAYGQGDTARVALAFDAVDFALTDEAWDESREWFADITSAIVLNSADAGAQRMAENVLRAIETARQTVPEPDENGAIPAWADARLVLRGIQIQAPFYETLARGARGDAVTKLQKRLITLGYLTGTADGQFGSGTEAALIAAQEDLRAVEQAEIDAQATPVPVVTPAPTPDTTDDMDDSAPEATPEPGPVPETDADGVAEQAYLMKLYGTAYPIMDREIALGAKGEPVARVQRRLIRLGYLTGKDDGDCGEGTVRALRVFQYCNDIPQTGTADIVTQRLLFSDAAREPASPILRVGASGDAVTQLQKRLIRLGFMTGTADGDYGNSTRAGVENLQAYLRERETEQLLDAARAERAARQPDVTPAAPTVAPASDAEPLPEVQPTIVVNGVADPIILDAFYDETFPEIPGTLQNGDAGSEVKRLQRRLYKLEYVYSSPDGAYGNATEDAVRKFQKRNELTQSGIADKQTLRVLFSDDALKALKPYVLKVSVAKQRVYAYGLDSNNEHTVLVRTMKCSTGLSTSPTPKGTYQASTGPGARWHYFKKFYCWAQYAYYIQGDIMFHSVLYNSKGGAVTKSSVYNLGRRASHGCVRLAVEDAKWIWNNCPRNTKVVVY